MKESSKEINFLTCIVQLLNKYILADNSRDKGDTPVKLSVVGPAKSGIWRRERIRMTDQEMDDVAFLTGIVASIS